VVAGLFNRHLALVSSSVYGLTLVNSNKTDANYREVNMVRIYAAALLLLGVKAVSAWDHVSSGELKRIVDMGEPVLVACEYRRQHQLRPEELKLTAGLSSC
jgi:hypothetical protein